MSTATDPVPSVPCMQARGTASSNSNSECQSVLACGYMHTVRLSTKHSSSLCAYGLKQAAALQALA